MPSLTRRDFLRGLGAAAVTQVFLPRVLAGKPLATDLQPLRIGFLTDCHAMAEHGAPEGLTRTAEMMNGLHPDLIIGGGDFVHGGFYDRGPVMNSRWRIADTFLRKLHVKLEPVIGNHDFYEPLLADGSPSPHDPTWRWKKYFGLRSTHRSFAFRGYRFIILDSVKVTGGPNPYRGWIDASQLLWLERELSRIPANEPIILCSHVPFTTMARDAIGPMAGISPGRIRVLNSEQVLEKLRGRPLAVILQGHVHLNERVEQSFDGGRVPCITGGAVCGKWWRGPNLWTHPGCGLIEIIPSTSHAQAVPSELRWNYLDTPDAAAKNSGSVRS